MIVEFYSELVVTCIAKLFVNLTGSSQPTGSLWQQSSGEHMLSLNLLGGL
jgi:hypothetical protein